MLSNVVLTASLEDYLETIFHIIAEKQAVQPKEIARRLKVANSSVTGALRSLAKKNLINYFPHDVITFTPDGEIIAKDVIRRHEVLQDFFERVLVIDRKEAASTACKMEHSISKVVLERLVRFIEFVDTCPRSGEKWIEGFSHNCDYHSDKENCEKCISLTLKEFKKRNSKGDSSAITTLRDLNPGQKGKIVKINSKSDISKRIIEMGVVPGSVIEVERVASSGDHIDVRVKGYHLSLHKNEVEEIEVVIL